MTFLLGLIGITFAGLVLVGLKSIMAKLSTLAGTLATIETTLNKVKTEVETLKGSFGDAEIPAEAQASLDRLAALSTALDAINDDATTEPAPVTPE